LEFLNFISVTNYIKDFLLVGLKDTVALKDLPNGLFVFGESSKLSIDLGLVLYANLLLTIFQNFNVSVVNFLSVNGDDGSD